MSQSTVAFPQAASPDSHLVMWKSLTGWTLWYPKLGNPWKLMEAAALALCQNPKGKCQRHDEEIWTWFQSFSSVVQLNLVIQHFTSFLCQAGVSFTVKSLPGFPAPSLPQLLVFSFSSSATQILPRAENSTSCSNTASRILALIQILPSVWLSFSCSFFLLF